MTEFREKAVQQNGFDEAHHDRLVDEALLSGQIPSYGLTPSWECFRHLGGHGVSADDRVVAVDFIHEDANSRESELTVGVHTAPPPEPVYRRLAAGMLEDEGSGLPHSTFWVLTQIPVDGDQVAFNILRGEQGWEGYGSVAGVQLHLSGRKWPVEDLELERVDPRPYIQGSFRPASQT
jgi:hypothetical protein